MSVCIKSLIKNVNLIVGCDIGCPYCYARNNCRRFHMTDDFSKPVFFRNKLHILDNKQPHVWFMTGLSDFTGRLAGRLVGAWVEVRKTPRSTTYQKRRKSGRLDGRHIRSR